MTWVCDRRTCSFCYHPSTELDSPIQQDEEDAEERKIVTGRRMLSCPSFWVIRLKEVFLPVVMDIPLYIVENIGIILLNSGGT